jgi:hypothetical protein
MFLCVPLQTFYHLIYGQSLGPHPAYPEPHQDILMALPRVIHQGILFYFIFGIIILYRDHIYYMYCCHTPNKFG